MDLNPLTQKSRRRCTTGRPSAPVWTSEVDGEHSCWPCSTSPTPGAAAAVLGRQRSGTAAQDVEADVAGARGSSGPWASPGRLFVPSGWRGSRRAERRPNGSERVRLGRAPGDRTARRGHGTVAGRLLRDEGLTRDSFLRRSPRSGQPAGDVRRCGGRYEALAKYGRISSPTPRQAAGPRHRADGGSRVIRSCPQGPKQSGLIGDRASARPRSVEGLAQRITAATYRSACAKDDFRARHELAGAGAKYGASSRAPAGRARGGTRGRGPDPTVRRRVAHGRRGRCGGGAMAPAHAQAMAWPGANCT